MIQVCPANAGGVRDVAAAGWTVQHTKAAVLLETAWGCGGSLRDVLLSGWAVDNATSDVLRINARSTACEVHTETLKGSSTRCQLHSQWQRLSCWLCCGCRSCRDS